jgi:hypothetical protein
MIRTNTTYSEKGAPFYNALSLTTFSCIVPEGPQRRPMLGAD